MRHRKQPVHSDLSQKPSSLTLSDSKLEIFSAVARISVATSMLFLKIANERELRILGNAVGRKPGRIYSRNGLPAFSRDSSVSDTVTTSSLAERRSNITSLSRTSHWARG